ncbi:hypothetical protein DC20_03020 [Rufibacter tibetensis]|uniref:Uncharacterized protein n=1 Tax=Rufibacter tibetensis TaxID=512763 RepID=A0A0N7HW34_9BACT|nr:hypothetical protein DC20_03020 [Rufibacter tibetensis]
MSQTTRKFFLQDGSFQRKLTQPVRRLQPLHTAPPSGEEKDWEAVHSLVNQLSSSDPLFPFSPSLVTANAINTTLNYFNRSFLYLFLRRLLT